MFNGATSNLLQGFQEEGVSKASVLVGDDEMDPTKINDLKFLTNLKKVFDPQEHKRVDQKHVSITHGL